MKLRWRHSCTIIDVIREPVPSPQIFLLIGLLCGATAIYTGMPNEGRADFGKLVGADSTRTHWSSIGSHLMQSNQSFNVKIAYICDWQPCQHSWNTQLAKHV